jgi:hypothetical protein
VELLPPGGLNPEASPTPTPSPEDWKTYLDEGIHVRCFATDATGYDLDDPDPSSRCAVRSSFSPAQQAVVDYYLAEILDDNQTIGGLIGSGAFYDEFNSAQAPGDLFPGFGMTHLLSWMLEFEAHGLPTVTNARAVFLSEWNTDVVTRRLGNKTFIPSCKTSSSQVADTTNVCPLIYSIEGSLGNGYLNHRNHQELADRTRELLYHGGFKWAVLSPVASRAQGLEWLKAGMALCSAPTQEEPLTCPTPIVPNFMLWRFYNDQAFTGNRDPLDVGTPIWVTKTEPAHFTAKVYYELQPLLPSYSGYGAPFDSSWDFRDDLVLMSEMSDSVNDAYLAIANGFVLDMKLGSLPYFGRYRPSSLVVAPESTCLFETMVRDWLDYSEAQRYCGDYLEDTDSDGVFDVDDNCLWDANPGQEDIDGDGIGDACDA